MTNNKERMVCFASLPFDVRDFCFSWFTPYECFVWSQCSRSCYKEVMMNSNLWKQYTHRHFDWMKKFRDSLILYGYSSSSSSSSSSLTNNVWKHVFQTQYKYGKIYQVSCRIEMVDLFWYPFLLYSESFGYSESHWSLKVELCSPFNYPYCGEVECTFTIHFTQKGWSEFTSRFSKQQCRYKYQYPSSFAFPEESFFISLLSLSSSVTYSHSFSFPFLSNNPPHVSFLETILIFEFF